MGKKIFEKGENMTKILFEKYGIEYREEKYHAWTRLFNNIEELIKFMEENKEHVLTEDEMLVITSVEEAKDKE